MNEGMYVEGYNYHTMYNIMANNIIENLIPIDNFIYTFQQVNDLYNFLTPLILNDQIIAQNNANNAQNAQNAQNPQNAQNLQNLHNALNAYILNNYIIINNNDMDDHVIIINDITFDNNIPQI